MENPQQHVGNEMRHTLPKPTTAPTPGVHTAPRPHPRATFEVSAPASSAPPNHDPELLYPRWFTLTSRTVFTVFDIVVLAITLRFLSKWHGALSAIGNPFPADRYALAVATVAVALVIDPLAVITSAVHRYGTYRVWAWAIVFDTTVGILGVCTPLAIEWVDRNGYSSEELGWVWEGEGGLIGLLALAVG